MSALEFHALEVSDVERLTDDSVAVTFDVPPHLENTFRYLPGQHITLRSVIDGEDVRRSYSICANANRGTVRVGIRRLDGGLFSTWATTRLGPGTHIDVMPPVGEFTITPDPGVVRHYGAVVAGSGITPVLSLISTTLEAEPGAQWTLIFGNRASRTVMFLEDLQGLKDKYPGRLQLVNVFSREDAAVPLFSGRIDGAKLEELFDTVVEFSRITDWYLCGPFELVKTARAVIANRGVESTRIHDELFFAGPLDLSALPAEPGDEDDAVALTITLDGRSSSVKMRRETSVLDAALSVRHELPYSCKGGMCASCKAKVIAGSVAMTKNFALVDADLEAGYVLTCQAHPTADIVAVDFDQR